MNLDIGALIEAKIASIKAKFKQTKAGMLIDINRLKKEIEEIKTKMADDNISMDDHIKLSEELDKKEDEKRKLEDELLKEVKEFHQGVLSAIEEIKIFGFDIKKMIGGKIDSTVASIEEKIAEFSLEFQDFKLNWHKKILFEWVKIVKKFFSAIGLGKIFEFLFLTWCDFLKLIGMPFAIPGIAGIAGVLSTGQRNTPVSPRPSGGDVNIDDEVNFQTTDGETDRFAIPTSSGDLKVFKNGVEQTAGILGTGDYTISGGSNPKVIFNSMPLENESVSILKI